MGVLKKIFECVRLVKLKLYVAGIKLAINVNCTKQWRWCVERVNFVYGNGVIRGYALCIEKGRERMNEFVFLFVNVRRQLLT